MAHIELEIAGLNFSEREFYCGRYGFWSGKLCHMWCRIAEVEMNLIMGNYLQKKSREGKILCRDWVK